MDITLRATIEKAVTSASCDITTPMTPRNSYYAEANILYDGTPSKYIDIKPIYSTNSSGILALGND
jgi:hypothetical protein